MGQYYKAVNLDKRQYIAPHACGDGAKLLEFGCSSLGMMSALAILLADGNGRGGGDLHSENPIIGSWAGDRIVIAGDYADDGKFVHDASVGPLYSYATDTFENISVAAMRALCEDGWIRQALSEEDGWRRDQLRAVLDNAPANPISRESFTDAHGYVEQLLDALPRGLLNHLRAAIDEREMAGHPVE